MQNIPSHITPIAISSYVPEGINCIWYPEFAPSETMRKNFKNTGDLTTFRRKYKSLLHRIDIIERLEPLLERDCVFLCFEKNHRMCHRSIFAEYLGKLLDTDIEEYKLQV